MAQVVVTTINLEEQAGIILSLDEKIAELQELRKEKANEVREIMQKANISELKAGKHTFKLSEILRNTVDTKRLKLEFSNIYKALWIKRFDNINRSFYFCSRNDHVDD